MTSKFEIRAAHADMPVDDVCILTLAAISDDFDGMLETFTTKLKKLYISLLRGAVGANSSEYFRDFDITIRPLEEDPDAQKQQTMRDGNVHLIYSKKNLLHVEVIIDKDYYTEKEKHEKRI